MVTSSTSQGQHSMIICWCAAVHIGPWKSHTSLSVKSSEFIPHMTFNSNLLVHNYFLTRGNTMNFPQLLQKNYWKCIKQNNSQCIESQVSVKSCTCWPCVTGNHIVCKAASGTLSSDSLWSSSSPYSPFISHHTCWKFFQIFQLPPQYHVPPPPSNHLHQTQCWHLLRWLRQNAVTSKLLCSVPFTFFMYGDGTRA